MTFRLQLTHKALTVIISTGEVFASFKPATKPGVTIWEVSKGGVENTIRLKNVETGHYLSSSLPSYKVCVTEKADETADWRVFNKVHGSLVTASSLDAIFIQSVVTSGFLSVRSNEGWTAPGKVWTRGGKGDPTGAYSWEKFQIVNLKHEESPLEENQHLKEQLRRAQVQIQQLEEELRKLNEYKQFFEMFKNLASK